MNILVSIGLDMQKAIDQRWPMLCIKEVKNLDEVIECLAKNHYDLLILDVDMPGNEGLEKLFMSIVAHQRIALFSSKNNNNILARKLMLKGGHGFLSHSVAEAENINILKHLLS